MTGFVPEYATTATGGSEGSDQDMGMTPEDLAAAMLDAGLRSSRSLKMEDVKNACWTIG